jgi:hypothetical protein
MRFFEEMAGVAKVCAVRGRTLVCDLAHARKTKDKGAGVRELGDSGLGSSEL